MSVLKIGHNYVRGQQKVTMFAALCGMLAGRRRCLYPLFYAVKRLASIYKNGLQTVSR